MNLVIGLVGEKGSGKGTFIKLLKEIAVGKTVERIASSDVLGETLDLWDIPRKRRSLQDLAIIMNKHFGDTALAHAVHHRILKSSADIIVFDGMRWMADLNMFRSLPHNMLVYVTTDVKVRYERTKMRNEKKDEGEVSYDQFLEEEKVQTELDIPVIGAQAEVKIVNNENLDEYRKRVEEVYGKFISL